jgi:hypothetical protein
MGNFFYPKLQYIPELYYVDEDFYDIDLEEYNPKNIPEEEHKANISFFREIKELIIKAEKEYDTYSSRPDIVKREDRDKISKIKQRLQPYIKYFTKTQVQTQRQAKRQRKDKHKDKNKNKHKDSHNKNEYSKENYTRSTIFFFLVKNKKKKECQIQKQSNNKINIKSQTPFVKKKNSTIKTKINTVFFLRNIGNIYKEIHGF